MLALTTLLLAALLAHGSHADATDSAVGRHESSAPALTKVIQMLDGMVAEGQQALADEQVEFAKVSTFCTEQEEFLKTSISKSAEEIETLNGGIGVLSEEAQQLGQEIAALGTQIESDTADIKAAEEERSNGHAAYLEESKDYSESEEAIANAIQVLKKQNFDRPAGEVLVQLSNRKGMPDDVQSMIASFLDVKDHDGEDAPPEANSYEFQSGGIIEMLKRLADEFKGKLNEAQKAEMSAQHAHEMILMDLRNSVRTSEKSRAEKASLKAQKEENIGLNKKILGSTRDSNAEDQKSLQDLDIECREKASTYNSKQQLRKDEISAIQQALEILGGKAVEKGVSHLDLAQVSSSPSLAQFLKASSLKAQHDSHVRQRVRDFLSQEGAQLHSEAISLLAQKLEASPFVKVKQLIDSMITKLLDEANSDATHEGFCNQELRKSKITRTKLTQDIDSLTSQVESTKASIVMLSEDIATLQKEMLELQSSMKKATELRQEESANNKAKIKDARAAENAVKAAIAVLKQFYQKALIPVTAEFLQSQPMKMGSAAWDALGTDQDPFDENSTVAQNQTVGKVYTGQQDEAGGVVALLEVIQSDFASLATSTEQAEVAAVKEHSAYMVETSKNMAVKDKSIQMKDTDKIEAESKEVTLTADLKATQKEFTTATKYFNNLKPQCTDAGTTFEKRKASREQELASLKQALDILSS